LFQRPGVDARIQKSTAETRTQNRSVAIPIQRRLIGPVEIVGDTVGDVGAPTVLLIDICSDESIHSNLGLARFERHNSKKLRRLPNQLFETNLPIK
jgi:hypothetical protein